MNEQQRLNLKAMIDILSNGHQAVAHKGCDLNASILKMDEACRDGKRSKILEWAVDRNVESFEAHLRAQEDRIRRVREEFQEIKKNLVSPA